MKLSKTTTKIRRCCLLAISSTFLILPQPSNAFGLLDPHTTTSLIQHVTTTVPPSTFADIASVTTPLVDTLSHAVTTTSTTTAAAAVSSTAGPLSSLSDAFDSYRQTLYDYPLRTKMLTGVIIAVVADAIAQATAALTTGVQDPDAKGLPQDWYNGKRAVSFAAFDAVYRAAQHYMYPPMIQMFQGQYITGMVTSAMASLSLNSPSLSWAGPLEQALASQLIIIPLVYYPVFFALTGIVQGLTVEETIERARTTFIPIMKRNLLYWIPCQFAAFNFLTGDQLEPLQIPVLTGLGLIWTIILSLFAGAASAEEEPLPEPEMAQLPLETDVAVVLPSDASVLVGGDKAAGSAANNQLVEPETINDRLNVVLDELQEVEAESDLVSPLKNVTSSSY